LLLANARVGVAIAKNLRTHLDFLFGAAQRTSAVPVINERAIQPTCNDPPRTREVKRVLSRSFPPLLWISATRWKKILDDDALALSSGRRMNFALTAKKVSRHADALLWVRLQPDFVLRCCASSPSAKFPEKMP
jgi:hypothetical protein